MHNRTICLCCSSIKRVARCGQLSLRISPLLGCRLWRHHFKHSSFYLQSPPQGAERRTHDVNHSGSALDDISNVVDEELRQLQETKLEEARDVFIDDLIATLEAHRSTNRAAVVRKLYQKAQCWTPVSKNPLADFEDTAADAPDEDGSALSEEQGAGATIKPLAASTTVVYDNVRATDVHRAAPGSKYSKESEPKGQKGETSYGHAKCNPRWPADSIQSQQARGRKHKRTSSELLEYDAMYIAPQGCYYGKKTPYCPWLKGLGTFYTRQKPVAAPRR